jgi:hypothetical protein
MTQAIQFGRKFLHGRTCVTELVKHPFLIEGRDEYKLVRLPDGKVRWIEKSKLKPDERDVCA